MEERLARRGRGDKRHRKIPHCVRNDGAFCFRNDAAVCCESGPLSRRTLPAERGAVEMGAHGFDGVVEGLAFFPEIAPEVAVFFEAGGKGVNIQLRGI